MKKLVSITLLCLLSLFLNVRSASAHVVVKPASVGVGSWQTFTMGVPVEKTVATTSLRLVIPEGLEYVMPNVKPGWVVSTKKSGEGESARVNEIRWERGSIPEGQRDDFLFSAKVPTTVGEIHWKAYQTYADGTVVSWDADPKAEKGEDKSNPNGPYSVTQVVDDLKSTSSIVEDDEDSSDRKTKGLAVTALGLSVVALVLAIRKQS